MLRFFRSIRRKLFSEGKAANYTGYAIGEILLIVVGILIALQISDWNEDRKKSEKEIEILKAIKSELEGDLTNLEAVTRIHERIVNSAEVIISHIEQDLPYEDSLSRHFFLSSNSSIRLYSTAAFETLKSLGVDLISDDTLRQQIIRLYDRWYLYMDSFQDNLENLWRDRISVVYRGRFEEAINYKYAEHGPGGGGGTMSPVDFEALKKDQTYSYDIKTIRNQHKFYLERHCYEMKTRIDELVAHIGEEIQRLEE